MASPIRRLMKDLRHLRGAHRELTKDRRELKEDRRELKQDRRRLERQRDAFEDARKELKGDRKDLSHLRDARRARLAQVDERRQALEAAYDATIDPLTGQGDPALATQLEALGARRQKLVDSFDARLDGKQQEIAGGVARLARGRERIEDTRREVRQDKREVRGDRREIARDKERVKDVRRRALDHLRPAEYRMGLRQTNRARRALGLDPVDHVIRPGRRVVGYVNGSPRPIRVVSVGNGEALRADAARAYKKMVKAAHRAGVSLSAVSGFRSMAEQRRLYQLYLSGQGNLAAPPGYSNHQGGVAVDLGGVGGYGTRAFAWLSANAGRFGFRNTVSGEYWHWTYGVSG